MAKQKQAQTELQLRMHCHVARQIRQHCHSLTRAEVCGVLIGSEQEGITTVEASIAGANAVEGGTHVTFTQDTWEHIYRIKDREYPDHRIVGWYHSHPGFGVFLSEHDTFIHQNFFSSPQQVAWVYDPHSEEEGCFAWMGTRLERLSQFSLMDEKGGEIAGKSGKAEPAFNGEAKERGEPKPAAVKQHAEQPSPLMQWAGTVLGGLAIFLLGVLTAWYIFPRPVYIVVNPQTGEAMVLSSKEVDALSKALQRHDQQIPNPHAPNTPNKPAPAPKGKP